MRVHRNIRWKETDKGYEVTLRCRGRTFGKSFSSRKYGSEETALMAALAWRDEMRRKLGRRIVKIRSPLNRSGVIGVSRVCKTNPSGKEYWSWQAIWRINERTTVKRKFSILKYGEAKARALAIAARDRAIAETI